MDAGLPLGREGLAGRQGEAAASTPATLAPKRPAAPKGKTRNKRRRKFYDWLCCPCMRGVQDSASSSDVDWEETDKEDDKEPKKSKNKKEHEDRRRNNASRDRRRRRCDLKTCLRKLVHEHFRRNYKIKVQGEDPRLEEWEEERHWQRNTQKSETEGEVAVEEEKVQEKGQSGSVSWRLSCCCLFALLLLVAAYASTYYIILEETNKTPTKEQLKTEMTMAALLVVTAIWALCAFPSPRCAVFYEIQVLIVLVFCNMSLVLVTRAVLAAKTALGYWCWWVVGLLCPFLLLVLLCSLCRKAT